MIPFDTYQRNGQWLELPLAALNRCEAATDTEPALRLGAGSRPHDVRKRLLALALFPEKWVNRLFSIGGIALEGEMVRLLAFPAVNPTHDPLYRLAMEPELDAVLQAPILYEDDWCLVLDKPSGMAVHQNAPGHRGTLDEAAARHCLLQKDPLPVKHIHRLDDDTAGPVLFAKNELAQLMLDEAMRSKLIGRQYEAIIQGKMRKPSGLIDAPIGKDRHHSARRRVSPSGDHAITHYETVLYYREASLVRLQLETGRTHQIRVHLSHAGCPLVGDKLYGGSDRLLSHQALRGERLIFDHPVTGERVTVISPIPEWFALLQQKLGPSRKS